MPEQVDPLLVELAKRNAVGEGNINLFSRPISKNVGFMHPSKSTLYSTSGEDNGAETLVPGVERHGKGIFPGDSKQFGKAAMDQYHKTGDYLGKFTGPDAITSADMLGNFLHKEGASGLTTPPLATSRRDIDPEHLRQVLLYLLTRGQ